MGALGSRKLGSAAADTVRVLIIVAVAAGHTMPVSIARTMLYSRC